MDRVMPLRRAKIPQRKWTYKVIEDDFWGDYPILYRYDEHIDLKHVDTRKMRVHMQDGWEEALVGVGLDGAYWFVMETKFIENPEDIIELEMSERIVVGDEEDG